MKGAAFGEGLSEDGAIGELMLYIAVIWIDRKWYYGGMYRMDSASNAHSLSRCMHKSPLMHKHSSAFSSVNVHLTSLPRKRKGKRGEVLRFKHHPWHQQ